MASLFEKKVPERPDDDAAARPPPPAPLLLDEHLRQIRLHRSCAPFQDPSVIVDRLDHGVELKSLLIPPNIDETKAGFDVAQQIMEVVNTKGLSASRSSVGFTVIPPASIGILNHSGRIEVVAPGRWKNLNPRSSWIGTHALTQLPIQVDTLTVVRIPWGSYGFAMWNGRALVLAPGLHCHNDKNFVFTECKSNNTNHLKNATIDILRVAPGEYARVTEANVPKLLLPGDYAINGNFFRYVDSVSQGSLYVPHGNVHFVRVPQSFLCPVVVNNSPHLLGEGIYTFKTTLFSKSDDVSINTPVIRHSTITRFFVLEGQIALAWFCSRPIFITVPGVYCFEDENFILDKCVPATSKMINLGSRTRLLVSPGEIGLALHNNESLFLDAAGVHEYSDPNFRFQGFASVTDKKITLGSKTRVIVLDGEVGIAYRAGKLTILPPSIYTLDQREQLFHDFLSMKQQSLHLGDAKVRTVNCETKDFVEVQILAAVYYRIGDPEKVLKTVGDNEAIKTLVKETCIAQLQTIMRSTSLNQVAQSKVVSANRNMDKNTTAGYSGNVAYATTQATGRATGQATSQAPQVQNQTLFGDAFGSGFDAITLTSKSAHGTAKSVPTFALPPTTPSVPDVSGASSAAAADGALEASTSASFDSKWMQPPPVSLASPLPSAPPSVSPPPFFQRVHDEFIDVLHESFSSSFGILIENIRIEEFKLLNAELSRNISTQAISTAQTQTQLANLEAQSEIAIATQERDASVNRIRSQGDALKLEIETKSKMDAIYRENETRSATISMMARAEANAIEVKAAAEAKARATMIREVANAEAEATIVRAKAEKERAEGLAATALGGKLALMQLQTSMVGDAMKGIKKIIYLPPGGNFSQVPQMFAFPGRGANGYLDNDDVDDSPRVAAVRVGGDDQKGR